MRPLLPIRLPILAGLALVAASRLAHADWPVDGRAMCTVTGDQVTPVIASDGAGGAIVAWVDYRAGGSDLYAQHVLASGDIDPAWPADGRAVCSATNASLAPQIIEDGAGGAILAWQDFRGGATSDIYAQRVLASGAVDPAWPANGRAICTAAGDQRSPVMVTAGAGGAIIAWEDGRSGSDIYAQRLLLSGAVDPLWPANGRALCTEAHIQTSPAILTDEAAGAIVGWSDQRSGVTTCFVQHLLASGAVDPAWTANGVEIGAGPSALVTDGAGGALAAWTDWRSGTNGDIYAQHVLANGTTDPAWPAGGLGVCTTSDQQQAPHLVPDGAGGAVVAWSLLLTAQQASDLYANHVRANGTLDPAWPATGRALCTAFDRQNSPTLVSDGSGGALAAWIDTRNYGGSYVTDIYANHMLSFGVIQPAWPADGRALCTAAFNQVDPVSVSDGAEGAIVAWSDWRNGTDANIYVGRAQSSVADAPLGHAAAGAILAAPSPNPMRGRTRVSFTLPAAGRASVQVLDVTGRLVATLQDGDLGAGVHTLEWDGRTAQGAAAPNGLYRLVLRANGVQQARSLVVVH